VSTQQQIKPFDGLHALAKSRTVRGQRYRVFCAISDIQQMIAHPAISTVSTLALLRPKDGGNLAGQFGTKKSNGPRAALGNIWEQQRGRRSPCGFTTMLEIVRGKRQSSSNVSPFQSGQGLVMHGSWFVDV